MKTISTIDLTFLFVHFIAYIAAVFKRYMRKFISLFSVRGNTGCFNLYLRLINSKQKRFKAVSGFKVNVKVNFLSPRQIERTQVLQWFEFILKIYVKGELTTGITWCRFVSVLLCTNLKCQKYANCCFQLPTSPFYAAITVIKCFHWFISVQHSFCYEVLMSLALSIVFNKVGINNLTITSLLHSISLLFFPNSVTSSSSYCITLFLITWSSKRDAKFYLTVQISYR